MSKRTDAMKRKAMKMAKANLAKAKTELARHMRAFKLAARRYRVALRNS